VRRRAPTRLAAFAAAFALLAIVSSAGAATLPAGFTETQVVTGLAAPTAMAFAPDGRLFVAEQGGRLRVVANGTLLAQPFLTVTVDSSGERGLLGVAFDPAFASNGYVYVYYTATTPRLHNRVSRFTASGNLAVPGSEVPILDLNDLSNATNHNGGAIHFGPDGKLYVAVGDNADGANSQTPTNLLGKLLRINPDGTVPSDNPFFASATGINRAIWALGLRNPYTFSFQPGTGRMFVNDVGENTWEEINEGIAGSNYGWPTSEGPTSDPRFRSPIFWYGHGSGPTTGCAITGGAFYNPPAVQFPTSYVGSYFFADYCSGWIRNLDPANGNAVRAFATGAAAPVDLAVASDGTLYYLTRGGSSGSVYRVSAQGPVAPTITTQPASRTVAAGSSVNFSVAASGTAPLSYRWQRDGVDIPGATSSTYTIASAQSGDNGTRFRVVVSNAAGSATSDEAVLTIAAGPFSANVNFQPEAAPSYPGYSVDGGSVYGPRSNGLTYGWNVSTAAAAYDRNSRRSPDQRYDTLIAMQQGNPDSYWEIAVPNGMYTVRIVAGDANVNKKAAYRITAEGLLTVNGAPTNFARWVEGTRTVQVADGRLTIASGAGASNNRLCFLEISASS
jgi:glucose/arabinose dehydrogenase